METRATYTATESSAPRFDATTITVVLDSTQPSRREILLNWRRSLLAEVDAIEVALGIQESDRTAAIRRAHKDATRNSNGN